MAMQKSDSDIEGLSWEWGGEKSTEGRRAMKSSRKQGLRTGRRPEV